MSPSSTSRLGRAVNEIEETFIAILLGLMTVVTFANVIARYIFNANLLWALETTVYLFAWLVLIGVSYIVKVGGHLGVDAVVNLLGDGTRRVVTLLAAAISIVYAGLLLYGAWEYWAPFAGRNAWYEVNDIMMPDWLRFIEPMMNENEAYIKLPRFIPYFALPLGMALLLFRLLEVTWKVWTGRMKLLIASHEAEELVAEAARQKEA